jgi:hypothetical protein
MSVRQSELAWELDLSSNIKFILLELADHADPDGRHVFPSKGFIASRTGYSVRQIQRILHELEGLGLIEPVAYRKGGRGMATEYDLHLDPSINEKAVKLSGFMDEETPTSEPLKDDIHDISEPLKGDIHDIKDDIYDISEPLKGDIHDIKGDIYDISETLKGDICDIKGDIYDIKDDIYDIKGDTGVTPIVKKRHINVKETLGAEVATSTSRDSPDWFNVLSSLERFDQSFEICQDWVGKHGVPEVLAQRLAYSLKDWLSRQQAGSKALRGDPWTRFTAWVVRDLNEATPDAGGTDKYLVAQDEAKRRGK